jgi:hypothetical protein
MLSETEHAVHAAGYPTNRRGTWQHRTPKHHVNASCPKMCVFLKDGGEGGHKCPLYITFLYQKVARRGFAQYTVTTIPDTRAVRVTAHGTAHPQSPFATHKWPPPSSQHKAISMYVESPIPSAASPHKARTPRRPQESYTYCCQESWKLKSMVGFLNTYCELLQFIVIIYITNKCNQ